MGSEGEEKPSFTPKLLTLPAMDSPDHSGMETPRLQTPVSVPFKWEEEPGKPRPCTDLIILPNPPKCLELPPRLVMESYTKVTKTPSPTPGTHQPYLERSKFSSFRYLSSSSKRWELNDVVLGKKLHKRRGFLDSWGLRTPTWKVGKSEVDGASSVFSSFSSSDSDESANTRSHMWAAAIYEGLKQVIPWKARKSKKRVLNV
ncbi:Uncharacterized protein Adt_44885 [Abeliophyllum distichum]|uniref:Uncharacterized protein n=1 Tax=Abeliophyllum distichum TaxID=126358 RepID=A0ABD1PC36_9LAMI